MKKLLTFIIFIIPWMLSFTLLPFSKITITPFLLYFIFISLLFYIYINIFIINNLIFSNLNNNLTLFVIILYILNQTFNIVVLYYNNFLLSLTCGLLSFITLLLFVKLKS